MINQEISLLDSGPPEGFREDAESGAYPDAQVGTSLLDSCI